MSCNPCEFIIFYILHRHLITAGINIVCTVREAEAVLSTVRGVELSVAGGRSSLSVVMKAWSGLLSCQKFQAAASQEQSENSILLTLTRSLHLLMWFLVISLSFGPIQ